MKLQPKGWMTWSLGLGALLLAAAPLPVMAAGKSKGKTRPSKPVVLHLGDSFVNAGFRQALKPKFTAAGARYIVRAKHSTYIPTLPRALGIAGLMWDYRPSLVILTIGANEMRMPRPLDHAPATQRLSKLVSKNGTSCVWVTPPPPPDKGETGIVQVIKDYSAPCRVFDSTPLAPKIPRSFDHVHPTRKGGAIWAEAFWKWLQEQRVAGDDPWKLKPRPRQQEEDSSKANPAKTEAKAADTD